MCEQSSIKVIISILNSVFKCYLDVYLLTLVNCEGYTMYVDTFYKKLYTCNTKTTVHDHISDQLPLNKTSLVFFWKKPLSYLREIRYICGCQFYWKQKRTCKYNFEKTNMSCLLDLAWETSPILSTITSLNQLKFI
jgi:hypothetical protein